MFEKFSFGKTDKGIRMLWNTDKKIRKKGYRDKGIKR